MTHQLNLELPDDVYQPLAQHAQATGQTVEALAQAHLAKAVQHGVPGSRLRRWAGVFDSGLTDVATRHHEYLGQALHDELQGNKDG